MSFNLKLFCDLKSRMRQKVNEILVLNKIEEYINNYNNNKVFVNR
jgi:hypothetical protein